MASTAPSQQLNRSNTGLLAVAEKRALIWIAGRLPDWVNSDHLTTLGFVSLIATGAAYWYAVANPLGLVLVIPLFVLNWFGDSLDGTLARVRNCQRPKYGFYIDHILDAIGMFFLMAGVALSGYITPAIAFGFLIVYFLLSIEVFLATYSMGTFNLSFWSVGPTELRLLLIVGNLFALRSRYALIPGYRILLFDIGFAVGIAGMTAVLIQAVVRHTRTLYRLETK